MNMSRSMMLREQQRQRERALALRASQGHKPGDLVGVSKSQLVNSGLGVGEKPSEYHAAYDCTCCNQRFVWDIRQPLTECPLCHAGPKQKPNKLPKKRKTHRQVRKLKAMAEAVAQNGMSGGTFLNTPEELHAAGLITEDNMNELNETKEEEIARTEAARAAGTLIESGCIIETGSAPTPKSDDVKPDAVAPEYFYHELGNASGEDEEFGGDPEPEAA